MKNLKISSPPRLFTKSPTFCIYPFIHLQVGPNKKTQICCVAGSPISDSKSGKLYSPTTHTLDEIWNSSEMRETRRKMLSGEQVSTCKVCYMEESLGGTSHRLNYNYQWIEKNKDKEYILDRVKTCEENNLKAPPPLSLDVKPGSVCNLFCRMCNAENSSKIHTETKQLLKENKKSSKFFELKHLELSKDWFQDPKLKKNIIQWLPHIQTIYVSGGETLLIREFWDLMDDIKKSDCAKNIILGIHTNCTVIPNKLFNLLKAFYKINLFLSIDGHGLAYEYMRYPAKWCEVEKNIIKIMNKKPKNTKVFLEPVIQIYNILNLSDFLQWKEKLFGKTINLNLNVLHGPPWLTIKILPKNVRQVALEKILKHEKKQPVREIKLVKNILSEEPDLKFIANKLILFREYTEMLDKKRGQSFKQSLPELYELLEEDDSWRKSQAGNSQLRGFSIFVNGFKNKFLNQNQYVKKI